MDNLILAARLHSMGGVRADIIKAIESWHMTKAQIGGKTAFTDDMRARDKSAAANADATRDQRNADQVASATRLKNQEMQPRHEANLSEVDRITGGGDAQGNVNASSKGVDNPAQSIKDRFDRRQAGNPSMGDKARQGFGNVKEAVGNVGARVGAAGSKALSSAGEAIGNAATAAKDKMRQTGQAADNAMMGAARSLGRRVGTAQGQIQNAASKIPGVMNAASQLPGQVQSAYQGAKHGSEGGANRGGAYLPGIGGRVGNFAHGLKQGGVSGLMEQGLVGTARAGQQDKYGIGRQESKNMRGLHDSNIKDAGVAAARGNLSEGQQAAYGWNPEAQSQAAAAGGPAAPPAGAQEGRQLTPGDADGNGVLDSEEQKTKTTLNPDGSVKDQKTTLTQSAPSVENDPPIPDPAGDNSTGDPAQPAQPAQGGGGGGAAAIAGLMGAGNQGGAMERAAGLNQAAAAAGSGNSSGNITNVYGAPGGGAGGADGAGAGAAAGGAGGNKAAQDALAANAQKRANTSGGFGTGTLANVATLGLSGALRGGYNKYQRGKGTEQLQAYADGDYTKAVEMASTLAIRQDIEKGRLGDAFNALRGKNMTDEEIESNRARKRFEAIQQIERGKAFRAGHKPLTREQYEEEVKRMGAMHEKGGDRIAPFYALPPEEAPPEASPEEDVDENDIIERGEPWTVVENPFVNPFYSENAFSIRKEPAPQAEIEHSIIDDYIAKDLMPESETELSGFDTVEGDDLSLLPASVFAKSNPVGDDMSLLPAGWNADVE